MTHSSKEIFLEKISNGSHYSNFVNLCLKLGTGTPEDMISTNVSDNLDSNLGEFVLLCKYIYIFDTNMNARNMHVWSHLSISTDFFLLFSLLHIY